MTNERIQYRDGRRPDNNKHNKNKERTNNSTKTTNDDTTKETDENNTYAKRPVLIQRPWKLNFDLRAQLECRIFGAAWPSIWWISDGFMPSGAVAADIRTDSTSIIENIW